MKIESKELQNISQMCYNYEFYFGILKICAVSQRFLGIDKGHGCFFPGRQAATGVLSFTPVIGNSKPRSCLYVKTILIFSFSFDHLIIFIKSN